MSTIVWALIFIALLLLSILIIVELSKKIKKLEKENRAIANEYQIVYTELKKAEKKKNQLNSGDDTSDFDNSINILSDYAKGRT